MHVCHFCDTSVEGDYFRNIAIGLTRKGVQVSLAELGNGEPPSWIGEVEGVNYVCLGAQKKWQYPAAVRRLGRYLRDEKADILHTHLFFSGIIGVLAKRLHRKTQIALMRHHTSVVRMLGSRLHIAADKWMAEKADHVMTVSEAAKRYMIETDGIRRVDIDVVYLGFDFEKLSPNVDERMRVRREFGFADGDLVIGYVGNFVSGKGQVELIEAFEKVSAALPNSRLFLVGRGMLPEVRAAAEKAGEGKIVFAGWRSDVAACLNAMDIFVQPSLSEAFSQVLIEAMGVGLAAVATTVGGAAEVIENGVNGILVDPGNVDAISNEVTALLRDSERKMTIARAGAATVRERFTAAKMVERHYELYQRWLAE